MGRVYMIALIALGLVLLASHATAGRGRWQVSFTENNSKDPIHLPSDHLEELNVASHWGQQIVICCHLYFVLCICMLLLF